LTQIKRYSADQLWNVTDDSRRRGIQLSPALHRVAIKRRFAALKILGGSDRLHRRCHAERHHQDCGNPFHVTLPLDSIQRVEERTSRNSGELFLLNVAEIVDQIENTGSYVCFQIRLNTNIRNTLKVFSGIDRVSRAPNRHVA